MACGSSYLCVEHSFWSCGDDMAPSHLRPIIRTHVLLVATRLNSVEGSDVVSAVIGAMRHGLCGSSSHPVTEPG
jgi:hypothetical protein